MKVILTVSEKLNLLSEEIIESATKEERPRE